MPHPCPRHGSRRQYPGFTLIEVLVVVSLIGILASMSFGGWKRVMWRVRSIGAADALTKALMLARSDARTSQCNSGVFFDPPNMRYLRFVDSAGDDERDGQYTVGERILQDWTQLPPKMVVYSVSSSITPEIPLRPCGGSASPVSSIVQSGTFSVVFKPNGQSMGTFSAKLGIESFPNDTFHIEILPPTGLVSLEK